MSGHYFLSYSSADGRETAQRLRDALRAGPAPVPVWLDREELQPGQDWDDQIVEALRQCRGLLFLMTRDSVESQSVCKKEWSRALTYKKPVIPLLLHRDAEVPFRLQDRQHIDFGAEFDTAVQRLREHLAWRESPAGVLQALRDRLADAQRDFRRAEPDQRPRIEADVAWLREQVEAHQRLVDDPEGAARRASRNIAQGLERERTSAPPTPAGPRSINSPPASVPPYFQGRAAESLRIVDFLEHDAHRLLAVVGRGGTGKTVLVCRVLRELSTAGIVYLGGNSSRPVTSANLHADLCQLLPEQTAAGLVELSRQPNVSAEVRTRALLASIPPGRVVVLLDNFEDALDPDGARIKDQELADALKTVLAAPAHAVKVILTTRVVPAELADDPHARTARLDLDGGLSQPEAVEVLRRMDADGRVGLRAAPDAVLAELCRRTNGYPRALEALFGMLAADRGTSIDDLLSASARARPNVVVDALVGETFDRLDQAAQRVVQALAVFGRPVTATAVDFLLQPYLPGVDSDPILRSLVGMQVATAEGGRFALHASDRRHALTRTPRGEPGDRATSSPPVFSQFALLHRGADYFHQLAPDRAALLAEFDLRFQAEDHDAAAAVLAASRQELTGPEPPPTILVVDDTPVDRRIASGLLSHPNLGLGASVVQASNGEDGLAAVEKQPFDLVLTDMMMPVMDGLGLVEAMRDRFPLNPVVVMTAHGNEELAMRCLERGAASYIAKRNMAGDLVELVKGVLSVSRTARTRQSVTRRLTRSELEFTLDNDPSMVGPLIHHLQQSRPWAATPRERTRVGVALREALLNAMIRGNLEVPSALREESEVGYREQIARRLRESPYRERKVVLTARDMPTEALYVIEDEGPGFDPATLPDPTDPANMEATTGRGLVLVRTFMDEVRWNAKGNQITLVKRHAPEAVP